MPEDEIGFPAGSSDERELLMQWLRYLRGAVLRNAAGLSDEDGHWRPDNKLISIVGILNHLTRLEWRWIDGTFHGANVDRTEAEFAPGPDLPIDTAVRAYRDRAATTDAAVLGMALDQPTSPSGWVQARTSGGCCCISSTRPRVTPGTQMPRASCSTGPPASERVQRRRHHASGARDGRPCGERPDRRPDVGSFERRRCSERKRRCPHTRRTPACLNQ